MEEPRLRLGRPAWVEAPEVDLDWHVAETGPPDPLSDEEFRRAVGDVLSERLDHARPLWRIDALPLTGDRVGLIGRIHHAMADGVSAIKLAAGLLWDERVDDATPSLRSSRTDTHREPAHPGSPSPPPVRPASWSGFPPPSGASSAPARTPSSTATSARTARSPGRPSRSSG